MKPNPGVETSSLVSVAQPRENTRYLEPLPMIQELDDQPLAFQ